MKQRKLLPPFLNFDDRDYESFYTIEKIKPLKTFGWQINGDRFEFKVDSQILRYGITYDGLVFHGRIRFDRLLATDLPHVSSDDVYIRNLHGNKIWLVKHEKNNEYSKDFRDFSVGPPYPSDNAPSFIYPSGLPPSV